MKKSKKLLALLLGLALCGSMLTACQKNDGGNKPAENDTKSESDANTDTDKKEEDDSSAEGRTDGTMVVSVTGFENKFSPFFAQNADDMTVGADMTQLMLMYLDRVANPVLNGIEGETRDYSTLFRSKV